jgi:hypothetical protein
MRLDEQYFEDFRCIVCDGRPFDSKDGTISGLYGIEDLVGEHCAECGHIMSLDDLEVMTNAAEIHMIRSLFPPK